MPKIDPFKNKRLKAITETKTFSEGTAQQGVEITVTLSSKPGGSTGLSVQTTAEALAQRFDNPMSVGIHHEGVECKVSRGLCYLIATIQTLDAGEPADRYSFEEWVVISCTMPNAFIDVADWAKDLLGRYEGDGVDDDKEVTPVPNA